jgi:hypothetical protein
VFAELCKDILERISAGITDPVASIIQALGEWRQLLRSASGADLTSVVGLFGELEILSRLARMNPTGSLAAWDGYSGSTYDFQAGALVLEVKTTMAHEGSAVHIHGLDQLDPPQGLTLFICVIVISEDDQGMSVQGLVNSLTALGIPIDAFSDMIDKVGYSDAPDSPWSIPFRINRLDIWAVGQSFPGIRRSEIDVRRIRGLQALEYVLDLTAAGPPLPAVEAAALLQRLAGGGSK